MPSERMYHFILAQWLTSALALLKDINTRFAAAAGVSPDDMMITLYEVPARTSPLAQRANAVAREENSRPFDGPVADCVAGGEP